MIAQSILEKYPDIHKDKDAWKIFLDHEIHPLQQQYDSNYVALFADGSVLLWHITEKQWKIDTESFPVYYRMAENDIQF